mgnify:FL=1
MKIHASDRSELQRFLLAQKDNYEFALEHLKRHEDFFSDMIYFMLPQLRGVSLNKVAKHYRIWSLNEANDYLNHPILGMRLIEMCSEILSISGKSASQIFGDANAVKLQASITLFSYLDHSKPIFEAVLKKYFEGQPHRLTVRLLGEI